MEYLLKSSAVIAIFYLCYKMFLQRDTFFQSNRWFLLIGLFTAFTLPFVVIPIYIERTPILLDAYVFNDTISTSAKPEQTFSFLQLLYTIYILGVVFFLVRFVIQLLSLAKLIFTNENIKQGHYTFIKTRKEISPFSFFKWIVYNPDLFNRNELEQIITHEKVHAHQQHSIDILLTQLSCIVLWFNPFVWLYNKDLKQNLEFIADQNAQNKSDCKKSYQYTLLKTSMPTHQLALTNNFYNSLIKKRIVMLHKSKSKKINLFKYVLIIPILAIFLMSFNTKTVYVEKALPVTENEFTSNSFAEETLITNDNIEEKEETAKIDIPATKDKNKKVVALNTNTQKKSVKVIGDVEVVIITKNFTDTDFEKVTNDLKKEGITAKFKGIKRNDKGEITAIKINVSSKKSNANYNISSDEAIKPIKISFDEDANSISIGNGKSKEKHFGHTYAINSKGGGKHKIHKSGKGNNVFVFSSDEDYEIIHEDSIHFKNHGKKGKYKVVRSHSNVEIISDDNDKNVEVIVESDGDNEDEDVIIIKNDKDKSFKIKTIGKSEGSSKILVSTDGDKDPLYILDGKEIKKNKLEEIKPDDIESITVLKGDKVIKKYGDKAKDGVIEITTKK